MQNIFDIGDKRGDVDSMSSTNISEAARYRWVNAQYQLHEIS